MHILGRKPWAYYNDFEPSAVAWLKELIKRGLIADGEVDGRSILDVSADDLRSFTQCHFFAGIGGWSYALRLAGWCDEWSVWTGSPPCFPAGTLITTSRGILPIENVREGDLCLTHEGRWKPVVRTGSAIKPTIVLKGQGHFGIETTENHPFYSKERTIRSTRVGGRSVRLHTSTEASWTRADEMKGKWWALPRKFPVSHRPNVGRYSDLELALLAGLYVGDGWVSKGNQSGCLILGVNESKAAEIVDLLPNISFSQHKARTGIRLVLCDRELGAFLKANFGAGSLHKSIPLWMMSASSKMQTAFLTGWHLTDGTRAEMTGSHRITTASRSLAITGRMLLAAMGFSVSMRKIRTPDSTEIEGREVSQADYYTLSRSNCDRYRMDDEQHIWLKVKSVEATGNHRQVYDLEVADDHSYVADGIVVHNCQPFSAAGMQKGKEDARHLAPHFAKLVADGRPPILFGEQVASAAVFGKAASASKRGAAKEPEWAWIDDLSDRLEAAHYAVGASDIPAAGVGAPHIRQRTFFGAVSHEWLAQPDSWERDGIADGEGCQSLGLQARRQQGDGQSAAGGEFRRMADANGAGPQGWSGVPERADQRLTWQGGLESGLADAHGGDTSAERQQRGREQRQQPQDGGTGRMADSSSFGRDRGQGASSWREHVGTDAGWIEGHNGSVRIGETGDGSRGTSPLHGFWGDADWLFCRDGKWRPVEPALLGLVDGIPGCVVPSGPFVPASYPLAQGGKDSRRVMRLRGYGNAIVPQAAATFIQAFIESLAEPLGSSVAPGYSTESDLADFEDLL